MFIDRCDILDLGDGTAIVHGRCSVTGNYHATPPVPLQALEAYRTGNGHAQTLFPTLSVPEREFLITGTSPEGWRTGVLGLRPDSYDEPVEPTPPRPNPTGETTRVVIDRARWARARNGVHRAFGTLFDGEAYDCLGFYCQQSHGVADDRLLGRTLPAELGIHDLGDHADRLALLNDFGPPGAALPWTDGAAQEAAIAAGFAGLGITVEFTG